MEAIKPLPKMPRKTIMNSNLFNPAQMILRRKPIKKIKNQLKKIRSRKIKKMSKMRNLKKPINNKIVTMVELMTLNKRISLLLKTTSHPK